MIINVGNYVQLLDGAIFNINYVHDIDAETRYPFEGKCIMCTDNDIWEIGESASWSREGRFQRNDDEANINIHKVLTKENDPEYWL